MSKTEQPKRAKKQIEDNIKAPVKPEDYHGYTLEPMLNGIAVWKGDTIVRWFPSIERAKAEL